MDRALLLRQNQVTESRRLAGDSAANWLGVLDEFSVDTDDRSSLRATIGATRAIRISSEEARKEPEAHGVLRPLNKDRPAHGRLEQRYDRNSRTTAC